MTGELGRAWFRSIHEDPEIADGLWRAHQDELEASRPKFDFGSEG